MSNAETALTAEIVLAVQREFGNDVRLWRQNAGQAWTKPAFNSSYAYQILMRYKNGFIGPDKCLSLLLGAMSSRPIQMANKGAADTAGILAPNGKRLELEIKTDSGKQSKEQRNWERMIKNLGGIYGVIRSPEEAINLIKNNM